MAVIDIGEDPPARGAIERAGVIHFTLIGDNDNDDIRRMLAVVEAAQVSPW